jgi:hypothetical protein
MTTLLPDLSRDLAEAAERAAARAARPRRRLLRFGLPLLAGTLAAGGVAAGAVGLWSPQIGGRGATGEISRAAPPRTELATLGVLRRPQTAADRGAASTAVLRMTNRRVRVGAVRLLGAQGGHGGVVLVPVTGTGPRGLIEIARARRATAMGQPPPPRPTLCLYARDGDGAGVGCFTLADIRAGRADMGLIPPPRKTAAQVARFNARADEIQRRHPERKVPHYVQPTGQATRFGLVPDGIASVRAGDGPGAAVARVHDNFFVFVGRPARGLRQLHYLDAGGREVMHGPGVR